MVGLSFVCLVVLLMLIQPALQRDTPTPEPKVPDKSGPHDLISKFPIVEIRARHDIVPVNGSLSDISNWHPCPPFAYIDPLQDRLRVFELDESGGRKWNIFKRNLSGFVINWFTGIEGFYYPASKGFSVMPAEVYSFQNPNNSSATFDFRFDGGRIALSPGPELAAGSEFDYQFSYPYTSERGSDFMVTETITVSHRGIWTTDRVTSERYRLCA